MFIDEKILMYNIVVDYLFYMFIYVYNDYFEDNNLCSI